MSISLFGTIESANFQITDTSPVYRIIPLAYGALLLALAVPKARDLWRLNGFSGSGLVFVLIRDQVLYYVMYVSTIFELKKVMTLS